MNSNYLIKKAKLSEIWQEKLEIAQAKLAERRALWNREFDGLKGAEGTDRAIRAIIAPLSIFQKKKVREEDREKWIEEMSAKDATTKVLRMDVMYFEGMLKALDADKLTLTDIESKLSKL